MFSKQSDWRKNMVNPRQRMDLENCAIKKRIERDQSRRGVGTVTSFILVIRCSHVEMNNRHMLKSNLSKSFLMCLPLKVNLNYYLAIKGIINSLKIVIRGLRTGAQNKISPFPVSSTPKIRNGWCWKLKHLFGMDRFMIETYCCLLPGKRRWNRILLLRLYRADHLFHGTI